MDVVLNGQNCHYIDAGEPANRAVVFIHGFPFSHIMWREQVEYLCDRFRVVAYDIRGHGQSGVGSGQYLIDFFVDDLIALLDHVAIRQATLCGLSMGGYIALRTVERFSERVRALVLCDTRCESDTNEGKTRRADSIRALDTDGIDIFAENFARSVFTAASLAQKHDIVENIKEVIRTNPIAGIRGTQIALAARTDATAALAHIHVPTLILVGDQDVLTPPSAAEALHRQIAASRLEVIRRAAHLSNLENPEAFNRHLVDFLQTL